MKLFTNIKQGGYLLINKAGGGLFFWKMKHSWKIINDKNST